MPLKMEKLLTITEFGGEQLEVMRQLLSYPTINYVTRYFVRPGEYSKGLAFIVCCENIIAQNHSQISADEALRWGRYLTRTRLCLYDHMQMWSEYTACFEDMQKRYPDDDLSALMPRYKKISSELRRSTNACIPR